MVDLALNGEARDVAARVWCWSCGYLIHLILGLMMMIITATKKTSAVSRSAKNLPSRRRVFTQLQENGTRLYVTRAIGIKKAYMGSRLLHLLGIVLGTTNVNKTVPQNQIYFNVSKKKLTPQ